MIAAFFVKYWLQALIAGVLSACLGYIGHGIYELGYAKAQSEHLAEQLEGYKALSSILSEEHERAKQAEAKLADTLANLPKAAPIIRTVVRENPSNCVVPAAVADSLRDATAKANAN